MSGNLSSGLLIGATLLLTPFIVAFVWVSFFPRHFNFTFVFGGNKPLFASREGRLHLTRSLDTVLKFQKTARILLPILVLCIALIAYLFSDRSSASGVSIGLTAAFVLVVLLSASAYKQRIVNESKSAYKQRPDDEENSYSSSDEDEEENSYSGSEDDEKGGVVRGLQFGKKLLGREEEFHERMFNMIRGFKMDNERLPVPEEAGQMMDEMSRIMEKEAKIE